MGVTVGDGDVPISGDQLLVGSATDNLTLLPMPGPTGVSTDNAFTSRIDQVAADGTGSNITTRDPAPVNNYGYDARMIDVTGKIPAGSTQAVLQINGAGDALHPQAVWLAVDALEPDLQITKANTPAGTTDNNPPGNISPGDSITYTFTVANQHADGSSGDLDTATGITVTDQLPAGTTFVAGSNPSCTAAGQTVTCQVADLAPGASTTVAFRATVDEAATAGTVLDDSATLAFRGNQTQREQTRTSNTVRNTVVDTPVYSIEKTATPTSTTPGKTVGYRIKVTNTGRVAAPGVTLDDNLADVLSRADYNGDAATDLGNVTVTGSTLHWTGDLPVGGSATIAYSVTVHSSLTADTALGNTVTSATYRNNCRPGEGDARCHADVTVTVPTPTPSPTASPHRRRPLPRRLLRRLPRPRRPAPPTPLPPRRRTATATAPSPPPGRRTPPGLTESSPAPAPALSPCSPSAPSAA